MDGWICFSLNNKTACFLRQRDSNFWGGLKERCLLGGGDGYMFLYTLPETNIAPENRPSQ